MSVLILSSHPNFLLILQSNSNFRKAAPIQESLVLHVDSLSRNVNEGHLKEIFGMLIALPISLLLALISLHELRLVVYRSLRPWIITGIMLFVFCFV